MHKITPSITFNNIAGITKGLFACLVESTAPGCSRESFTRDQKAPNIYTVTRRCSQEPGENCTNWISVFIVSQVVIDYSRKYVATKHTFLITRVYILNQPPLTLCHH